MVVKMVIVVMVVVVVVVTTTTTIPVTEQKLKYSTHITIKITTLTRAITMTTKSFRKFFFVVAVVVVFRLLVFT